VTVHDISGRRVRTLLNGELGEGADELVWDGLNDHQQRVSTGIYWIALRSAHHRESMKIIALER
jgi:flagellar hook assembly protein FlgD